METPRSKDRLRVIAIVAAYNEADVISPVIGNLVENGVDVYLIDNRSTDGTAEEAGRWLGKGLIRIETFPAEAPASGEPLPFDWTALLARKETLAQELEADWFLHHDADEIREPPWPGMNLRDSIEWVDRLGYNCIGFRVFHFPPVDDGFVSGSDPREHFRYWKEAADFDRSQLKCWKGGRPVSLVPSGGHEAAFPNRNVFPIPFLMRHYPIRTPEQGRRKVFEERKGRFVARERARDWHIQYDSITDADGFLSDPADLRLFDRDQARLELMLANEVTRWAEYQARQLQTSLDELQGELDRLRSRKPVPDAAERIAELERALGREEGRSAELERTIAELEARRREDETRLHELHARIGALGRELEIARGDAVPSLARRGKGTEGGEVR